VAASNLSSIAFTEPNGSYDYSVTGARGYLATPARGAADVIGTNSSVNVTFSPVPTAGVYRVGFHETGLPAGTSWSVRLNGTTATSSTNSVNFSEPNGSYRYTVPPLTGYSAAGLNGSVVVDGASQNVSFTFVAVYPLTFSETGLPDGSNWSVTITSTSGAASVVLLATEASAVTHFSDGGSVVSFDVSNGTYTYTAAATGHSSLSGIANVDGAPVAPSGLVFPGGTTAPPTTSSSAFPWLLFVGAIVLVIVVLLVAAVVWEVRRPPTNGTTSRPPARPPNDERDIPTT
jgi:hypothetical protein